jgi:hypothetical protein
MATVQEVRRRGNLGHGVLAESRSGRLNGGDRMAQTDEGCVVAQVDLAASETETA